MSDDDDVVLPTSWVGGGGGPTGVAVIALLVGVAMHLTINDLDLVMLGAGGTAVLFASIGSILSLRARARGKAAFSALCALGGVAMVAMSGVLGALPLAALGSIFGPSDDEIRGRIASGQQLTDVVVTREGPSRYAFTGRRGHERCSGEYSFEGGLGGETSHVAMRCALPEDVESLEAACRDGVAEACGRAADLLDDAEPIDWARMNAISSRGCEDDQYIACFYLGVSHEHGHGRDVDLTAAVRAYRRACEHGSQSGCINAGLMVFNGRGTAEDKPAAVRLWTRGCDAGSANACELLGECYREATGVEQDLARARQLFEGACERDEGPACTNLASMYLGGQIGDAPDPARAFSLYERGCEHGSPAACRMMGELLEEGRGITADVPRALTLYTRACDAEEALGCVSAGMLHHRGAAGVPVDHAAALVVFERACTLRDLDGCNNAGVYYRDGRGGPASPERARERFQQACDLGHSRACRETTR